MNDVISQESQPVPSEADRILAQDLLGDYGMGRGAVEKIAAHVAASTAQIKSEAAVYKRLFDGLVKLRPIESGTLDEWVDAMLASAASTAVLREELRVALERITRTCPAYSADNGLFVVHFDENGTETGIEAVDPLAVINEMEGIARRALAQNPEKP